MLVHDARMRLIEKCMRLKYIRSPMIEFLSISLNTDTWISISSYLHNICYEIAKRVLPIRIQISRLRIRNRDRVPSLWRRNSAFSLFPVQEDRLISKRILLSPPWFYRLRIHISDHPLNCGKNKNVIVYQYCSIAAVVQGLFYLQ